MTLLPLLLASSLVMPSVPDTTPRGRVHLAAGYAEIHGARNGGWIAAVGYGWRPGSTSRVILRLDVAYSTAEEGFVHLSAGPELQLLPSSRLSPVALVGAGALLEPEYAGWAVSGGLGVRLALGRRDVRVLLSRGLHGGASGPHTILLGMDLHF